MTEYVHVGRHADVLESGRGVGPGDRVQDAELGDHDQILINEGILVDVDSFGGGPSNQPDPPSEPDKTSSRSPRQTPSSSSSSPASAPSSTSESGEAQDAA